MSFQTIMTSYQLTDCGCETVQEGLDDGGHLADTGQPTKVFTKLYENSIPHENHKNEGSVQEEEAR